MVEASVAVGATVSVVAGATVSVAAGAVVSVVDSVVLSSLQEANAVAIANTIKSFFMFLFFRFCLNNRIRHLYPIKKKVTRPEIVFFGFLWVTNSK